MNLFCDPQTLLTRTALIERFLSYVRIDTQSNENSNASPSTEGQRILAERLAAELTDMAVTDARVDENGYLTATIPGDQVKGTVGLIAHLDTSPEAPSKNVRPMLHSNYDGKDIALPGGVTIIAAENPELNRYIGNTIITSDGTTLLGADDKAGIAVIMSAAEYWMAHPEIPRPRIRIGFTPDEEIGRGAHHFPLAEFGADIAYTLDGSFAGEVNLETFEADAATITFNGVGTHPGQAKGKLVNALKWMARFIDSLPAEMSPEATEGREGFMHPIKAGGDTFHASVSLILRDFETVKLRDQTAILAKILGELEAAEPRLKTELKVSHTYPNMGTFLNDKPEIRDRLERAIRSAGVVPVVIPIRGGTDGSVLTKRGLLCPNIFAGGMNFHDKREWVADKAMALSLCTVLNLMIGHTV